MHKLSVASKVRPRNCKILIFTGHVHAGNGDHSHSFHDVEPENDRSANWDEKTRVGAHYDVITAASHQPYLLGWTTFCSLGRGSVQLWGQFSLGHLFRLSQEIREMILTQKYNHVNT